MGRKLPGPRLRGGIGAEAQRHGVSFAYHNHGYGQHPIDGEIPLHLILKKTDPTLVFFEMDIYWTAAGGGDPIQLLKDYPTRYKMLHLKDMKELQHFSGNGGDPSQWMALFPYMTSVGDGVLDIKGIVRRRTGSGLSITSSSRTRWPTRKLHSGGRRTIC